MDIKELSVAESLGNISRLIMRREVGAILSIIDARVGLYILLPLTSSSGRACIGLSCRNTRHVCFQFVPGHWHFRFRHLPPPLCSCCSRIEPGILAADFQSQTRSGRTVPVHLTPPGSLPIAPKKKANVCQHFDCQP